MALNHLPAPLAGLLLVFNFSFFNPCFSVSCETPWDAGTTYAVTGLKVSHNGVNYTSNWWTKGDEPPHGAWTTGAACAADPGPTVTTSAVSSIGGRYATLNGEVTSDNGNPVTAMGFLYYTAQADVIAATIGTPGSCTVVSHGTPAQAPYSISVNSFSRNQDYWVKSYAANADGTTYGAVQTFTTTNTGITFTSSADGSWTTGTNWTPNGVPNLDGAEPLDTVIIEHNISHTGNFTIEDGNVLQTNSAGNLTLTGNIMQGLSGVTGSIINAGTLTGSGTYTPLGANGIFTNTGSFTFGTWAGSNSWDMNNSGDITTTGAFTHNGTGTFTSTGGTIDVNSFTIGPSGAAMNLSGTTLRVATDVNVNGSGTLNSNHTSPVYITGSYTNSGSVSSSFLGATSITGDYINTGSATITVGGAMTVGGDVSGSGSGDLTINGSIDITGELSLRGSALLNGSGVLKYDPTNVNVQGQSSTGYVVCTDGSRYDSEVGAIAADIPANPFDLSSCGLGVLSAKLLFFKVSEQENKVNLTWSTASEINNSYFQVKTSQDAINWEVLTEVPGAGNSSQVLTYQVADFQIKGVEQKYYQLAAVDGKGYKSNSAIKYLLLEGKQGILSYFDNGSNIVLSHNIKSTSLVITLYDTQGNLVHVQSAQGVESGKGTVLLPSSALNAGMYYLTINGNNQLYSMKVVVDKVVVQ